METRGPSFPLPSPLLVEQLTSAFAGAQKDTSHDKPSFWFSWLWSLWKEQKNILENIAEDLLRGGSISNESPTFIKSDTAALSWKEKGNAAFSSNNYIHAFHCYTEVSPFEIMQN